jgi:peroxiredoxin
MKKAMILLAAATMLAGCFSEKKNGSDSLPLGAQMPEFSVSGPSGTMTSNQLKGTRSVVVFFRTTCPDCSREMPNVETAFKRVAGSGVRFVAVSKEDDAVTKVPEYWEATGMTMPWYLNPTGEMFTAFDIHFVPTLYLFGSDGKVAYSAVETFDFSADELVELIEALK